MMADMQRARLIAGELPKFGWEAEILTPGASFQTDFSRVQGHDMAFPDVPVHEVPQWHPGVFQRIGSRNVGIRAAVPVGRAGIELLRSKRFDLVYFSTTQHWLTCNGARWRRRTGVPYVADLHDPVYLEKKVYFVSRHRIKERLARRVGKMIERLALGRADGLVSVSQGYVDDVARRNPRAPWVERKTVLIQPFAADLAALSAATPRSSGSTDTLNVIYIGAGGSIMEKGWREFLRCLAAENRTSLPSVEILGTDTSWQEGGRRYLQDVAAQFGLSGVVTEEPARISYQDSISRVKCARGLLILGVDDPNYRPSKLHTYLATGLPLLAIVRAESQLREFMDSIGPGIHTVIFSDEHQETERNQAAVNSFLREVREGKRWSSDDRVFLKPGEAARAHAELFDKCIRRGLGCGAV